MADILELDILKISNLIAKVKARARGRVECPALRAVP
jgi:hypothetical protein